MGNDHVSVGLFHRWTENVRFVPIRPNLSKIFQRILVTIIVNLTLIIDFFLNDLCLHSQQKQLIEVDRFLAELIDDFVSQGHLQELLSLKDQLSDIAAEKPNLTTDREDILDHFKPFEPVVEALRAKYALAEMQEEE
jgi:hypothetical protein